MKKGFLIVYKCVDTGEEEACFFEEDIDVARDFIENATIRPDGFEDREGYYFMEESEMY